MTGGSPWVWVSLPGSGDLWVGYSGGATQCVLWHQGGDETTINQGAAVYPSQPGDFLGYEPASPDQPVKLAWAYTS